MFGRLVEIEGVDPSKREEVLGIIRERIILGLKEIGWLRRLHLARR